MDNAPSNSGADGEVYVSQGSVYDFHHIGETLWEGTNNDPNGNSWVEGGFHYVGNNNQLSLYWAEWPPGGNYSSHPVTGVTPSVNNWYDVQIKIIGYEEWGVYVDQVYQGYSPQPGWSENLSAGLESTSSTNRLSDSETGPLRYEQNNGTWVTNWPSATFLYCNSPANVWWAVVDQTVADSM